jgi:fumarylacetoacetate (FAA) hydrolase family protein
MTQVGMGIQSWLPDDWERALLLGRVDRGEGPLPVMIRDGHIEDLSAIAPTTAQLLNRFATNSAIPPGDLFCALEAFEARAVWMQERQAAATPLLAPVDLQCVKASGVTFAASALERVIEERARGDLAAAERIRESLAERIGGDLKKVRPGSDPAASLKQALIADGLWSQYLEVAIGPDAEVFTKAPLLSSVGWGEYVGIRSDSHWNNPEPEIVLVCDATGRPRGAALGNDMNLRDFEGRSALLLGKSKDNNASCAIGPMVRLFDGHFTLDHVRNALVRLDIKGNDGFALRGESSMSLISRDPLELVKQTAGKHHQYPDGFALFLGTMYAPIQDRDVVGEGFTHKVGDRVRVSTPTLGALENEVTHCSAAPPWTFGVSALMQNLASRGLLE